MKFKQYLKKHFKLNGKGILRHIPKGNGSLEPISVDNLEDVWHMAVAVGMGDRKVEYFDSTTSIRIEDLVRRTPDPEWVSFVSSTERTWSIGMCVSCEQIQEFHYSIGVLMNRPFSKGGED